MAGRLGKVLYWLGCIIAGLTALIGILIYASEGYGRKDGPVVTGFVLVVAFAIWLIGVALRYVLSGPSKPSAHPETALNAPSWETYAQRIYTALPAADSLGDMTPEKLRIPPAAMQRYFEKALLQRETTCFVCSARRRASSH
jgi:hypothetical protein